MRLSIPSQLLPSFLQQSNSAPAKLHPTSYLDGVRGVAAFSVFLHHFALRYFQHFIPPYGFPLGDNGDPCPSHWIQLPYLRLLISGRAWVHLFFIVSGYALSLKPLKQIRARQYSGLLTTLSSSAFRRAMRLYLPLYVTVFIATVLACLGFKGKNNFTFAEQLARGPHALYVYSNFFDTERMAVNGGQLESHLWTIPLEMAFSMVLFISIVALSRLRTLPRMAILVWMIIYSWMFMRWQAAEFLLGMLLAEVGLIQDGWADSNHVPNLESGTALLGSSPILDLDDAEKDALYKQAASPKSMEQHVHKMRGSHHLKLLWQAFCGCNLIFALWIFSWPDSLSEEAPGWGYLMQHVTPERYIARGVRWVQIFWHSIGALQMVLACQQIPILQSFFTTRFVQYLGKLSFALYLLHQSVLDVFSPYIVQFIVYYFDGIEGAFWKGGSPLSFFVSVSLVIVPLFWIADLFYRYVDVRCVKLARNLEMKLVVDIS